MHPRYRLQEIIKDARQAILDVQAWNHIRSDEVPMDCEPERVVLRLAETAAKQWDAGDLAASQKTMHKLSDYADSVIGECG